MKLIAPSRRLRRTPFSDGVEAAGVSAYTVYNHTLLPVFFESLEADYHHLKKHVQVWDVSCERQIELYGPDASRLMQLLTPRDLSRMIAGHCRYVPIVDDAGGMLNDPVALKLADDRFWISIADSDLLLWVKGVVAALGMQVQVFEPAVTPLAIQGPMANDLAAKVFGESIRGLGFFRFLPFDFKGHTLLIARSGFSKQGGFEIYLDDPSLGMLLWQTLFEAGEEFGVRAGCPNAIERIEGGLLSYGNDMTRANNPFECGLGRFCDLRADQESIGQDSLLEVWRSGPRQQICPIEIQPRVPTCDRVWPIFVNDEEVGHVTSAAWSPDFDCSVAMGMVSAAHWNTGTKLRIETQEGPVEGRVREKFWN